MMGIKKDKYLEEKICLTYLAVDNLVDIVRKKGCGCLLFKRELRHFYRQIPVCPKDYSKLGCCFNGKMYFDKVLVMACRSSCFIAQSVTNAFKFILQKREVDCKNYLDDLGGAEIPDLAWNAFEKMGKLLEDLHVQESKSKACSPCTRMIFLGIVVDTVKMTLEMEKTRLHDHKKLLQKWENKTRTSLREVQSFVGILSFASFCFQQGRAFFSRILNFLRDMPQKGKANIPEDVRKDISWWRYIAPSYNGISYILATFCSKPDSWFSTNACLSGGGGYFNGAYFHFNFSESLIAKRKHTNQFELFVLWKAVELWAAKMRQKNMLIYCDNKTTVNCLHSSKSKCHFLQACIRNILHHCALNYLQIRAVHIKGKNNRLSDCLSRWDLDKKYQDEFHKLTEGVHTYECVIKNTEFIDLY